MPPSSYYICQQCPLLERRNHRVARAQRVVHQAELEAHHAQYNLTESVLAAANASDVELADLPPVSQFLEQAHLPEPVFDDATINAQQTSDPTDVEMERLANLFTGLVVLDDGAPSVCQSHSKLFSSWDDYQASLPEIPTEFTAVSPSEALSGVEHVLRTQSLPLRPTEMQTREINSNLLQNMLRRVQAARIELDFQHALNASPDSVGALISAVVTATSVVFEAGRLLSSIKPSGKGSPRKSSQMRSHAKHNENEMLAAALQEEAAILDSLIDVVGRILPLASENKVEHNTGSSILCHFFHPATYTSPEHHFNNPMANYNIVAQLSILLAIICHVVVGISTNPMDLIIAFVNVIIQATMSLGTRGKRATPVQEYVLKQLPTSLESALRRFKIDPATTVYATCPVCHYTHAPHENRLTGETSYPETCQGYVYPRRGAWHVCGTAILESRHGKLRPIKPFVFTSFIDYIAAMLSDPEIERMCEKACDDALAAVRKALSKNPEASVTEEHVNNVFEAAFIRSFKGPIPDKLFIQRDGRLRLAFQVMLDFFNPNGTRKRGNHNSIGILAVVNLNLTEDIRYRPEHMWLSIILGPNEPNSDQIDNYLRPLMDHFVIGWEKGYRLSRTALHASGRSMDLALVINVNDLPATRKAQGMAAANSHHYCSICDCFGVKTMYNTAFSSWTQRDIMVLRAQAYAWRDATTQAARDAILAEFGVRWSKFWRLPYWDPTRMAVVDSMHCILEGLVHYHCRRVLRIDTKLAKRKETMGAACEYNWPEYNAVTSHPLCLLKNETRELPMVHTIQQKLVQSLLADEDEDDEQESEDGLGDEDVEMPNAPNPRFVPAITEDEMHKQLIKANLQPLRWVVSSLSLNMDKRRIATKKTCCDQLLAWVILLILR
ncbi:unnamed protein product [Mycena citricolor]|uniref:Transposase family Tnp2 protein n=1 Tax=Mycena citricolor TaxID=2018698 RepID=A0AAD2K305_9AGAR|nr:unnamed protein product [Mycena citricolor]